MAGTRPVSLRACRRKCSATPPTGSSSSRQAWAFGTLARTASSCPSAPTAGGGSPTWRPSEASPRTAAGARPAAASTGGGQLGTLSALS
eukprot:11223257-Lingulodinium_polyedra.AAC.1